MRYILFCITLWMTVTVPVSGQTLRVEPLANPSGVGSLQANWSKSSTGAPLLSWTEEQKNGSYTLRYAVREGAKWSAPRTIAANRRFFRHPAELPGIVALRNGTLLAHWVEMPEESSEKEFLYVSASTDGIRWSAPVLAHKDRSPVQHGLASIAATGDNEASLLWLEALEGEDGPVTMKRSLVNAAGQITKEESLDTDVCACCPTSVVKTARGVLVAYRDHTSEDIRDISTLRFENGRWTPSKNLNPDRWKLNACPINAAIAAATGDQVAVAWYTGAQDKPRVQIAFSKDSGSTFSKPTLVSTGHSFGFTSMALNEDGSAMVSWLEQGANDTSILFRQVSSQGVAGPVLQIAKGTKASLGYPRILQAGSETWIAWGGSRTPSPIQTARVIR